MREHEVERINVLSLARVVGVIGLLCGIILEITWLVTGMLGGPFPGMSELLISIIGCLLSGFIVGGITAILYNASASLIGGLKIESNE